MANAAIVYCSDTWTTAGLADDIASELRERGIETLVGAIGEVDRGAIASADYVFLGCWTHGWFVVNQHPVQAWVDWAHGLPRLEHARVALFTTYKVRTGSMFPRMRRELRSPAPAVDTGAQGQGHPPHSQGPRRARPLLERGVTGPEHPPTEAIA